MDNNYSVYQHVTPDGFYYFGQTNDIKRRWKNNGAEYKGTALYPYIEQYGWDNIQHIVLFRDQTRENSLWIEDFLITTAQEDGVCINQRRSGNISKEEDYNKNQCKQYYEQNRDEILEQRREYYQQNRDEILEQRREYQRKNRDKILEQRREYQRKNRDKILEQRRDYYQKNRDKINEQRRDYYQKNREKELEQSREYYQKNREKKLEQNRQRYKRKKLEKQLKEAVETTLF